jgi:hypothetical protein
MFHPSKNEENECTNDYSLNDFLQTKKVVELDHIEGERKAILYYVLGMINFIFSTLASLEN